MPMSHRRRGASLSCALLIAAAAIVATGTSAQPAAATPPTDPPATAALTAGQALARARVTGQPVPIDAATTSTDTTTANPNGTFTLTQSLLPVRKRVGTTWKNLDATLVRAADGSLSPAVSTSALTFSGGGNTPLATMTVATRSLGLTLPVPLPTPTVTGPNATYPNLLPGVDLQVTADAQGGFREVLVVHDATAAANPTLQALTLATQTTGVTLSADPAGNLTAADPAGHPVFTAPAPTMWDSATTTPAAAATAPSTSAGAGRPAGGSDTSTSAGPGSAAHVAPIAVALTATTLTLRPDQGLLTGADTVYPVYVDPSWTPITLYKSGWATIAKSSTRSTIAPQSYWNNTPEPDGRMQIGHADDLTTRTLINFPIDLGRLSGATIGNAQLTITETYSYSCQARKVNLYAPTTTLTPTNASWNAWAGVNLGDVAASATVALGHDSYCQAGSVGFDLTAAVRSAVGAGRNQQTFALTAADEADIYSWKKFDPASPQLRIEYNHAPNTPTALSTSPTTNCTANPPTPVGDADIYLYAGVSDPDGGTVGVGFELWKTSAPATILDATDPNTYLVASGTTPVRNVRRSTLSAAAGGTMTQFSWHVRITDTTATTGWSTTCSFVFDPTRPGQPGVTQPPADAQIWKPLTVTVTPPPTGTTPTSYQYQLNGGPPGVVTATAGNATITVAPTRLINTLTVTSRSAGGNIGDSRAVTFNATPAATNADSDLTGDDIPDLVTVGATNGLPPGLWLAPGSGTGAVTGTATNIGINGNCVDPSTFNPASFTGAQIITGHFNGHGEQDVFVYYPSGPKAGSAVMLTTTGDGSAIDTRDRDRCQPVSAGWLAGSYGDNPLQFVNAGDSAHLNGGYPDLIAINGDTTNGYFLEYYASDGAPTSYYPIQLTTTTPTGGTDWNTWRLATTQLASGTAMYLRNATTGALYLWTDLAADLGTGTLTYTQYTLSTNWNRGAALDLRAADINRDGTADLWAVGPGGTVTAWLLDTTTTPPALTARPTQTLLAPTHSWALNDAVTGTATTAADAIGTLHATGTTGATWHTGDLFTPDLALDGTTGTLSTTGPALATNSDFAVAAWVKPDTTGGTVLSQDGTRTAGFRLWAEPSDASWRFALPTTDATNPGLDVLTAGPNSVRPGVWTQLTATYQQNTGVINLYVNHTRLGSGTHLTAWNATGAFHIGDTLTAAGTRGDLFTGQIAHVQVWNHTFHPAQPPGTFNTDFDGDGRIDFLGFTSGDLWFIPNTSTPGNPTRGTSVLMTSGWQDITRTWLADYDGDSKPDIIGLYGSDQLLVWRNASTPGHPAVADFTNLGTGWSTLTKITFADLTNDGKLDILGWNTGTANELWIIPNTSTPGNPSRATSIHLTDGWQTVTQQWVADYDGDGKPDILGLASGDQLLVWRNTSTPGHPAIASGISLGTNWNTLTKILFADLTNDGKLDILGWNTGTAYELWIIPNTSTPGNPSRATSIHLTDGWQTVTQQWVADYDGDGKTDILGLDRGDLMIAWRNTTTNGTPTLDQPTSLGAGWSVFREIH